MKKLVLLMMTVVFAASLLMIGCKKEAEAPKPAEPVAQPAPAPAPEPAPAPAPAKPAKR